MSNADMITAITNSIQTDANIIILIRALITSHLPIVDSNQLAMMCQALGISTSG